MWKPLEFDFHFDRFDGFIFETKRPFENVCALSLGRVDPAPHTQHLLGPFAAIAQNSALWSFSIVDSLANRQHSCGGSEELAILETAGSGLGVSGSSSE